MFRAWKQFIHALSTQIGYFRNMTTVKLYKADTLWTNGYVRFRQVAALDRFDLWDYDHENDIFGQDLLYALDRCPL